MAILLISIYGSAVASVVALIQLAQWSRNKKIFFFREFAEKTLHQRKYFDFTIANVGLNPVYIGQVNFAICYRHKFYVWKMLFGNRIPVNFVGASQKIVRFDGEILATGTVIRGEFDKTFLPQLLVEGKPDGWFCAPCVIIEHSADKKPFVGKLRSTE